MTTEHVDPYDIDPAEGLAYLAEESEDPWIRGVATRAIELRRAAEAGGDYSTEWALLIADVLGVASDASVPKESREALFFLTSRWAWDRRAWIRENQLHPPTDQGIIVRSRPVLWYELIREAEAVRKASGWNLGTVWGYVHSEQYAAARSQLDGLRRAMRDASKAVAAEDSPSEDGPE